MIAQVTAGEALGPLRVHPTNPRYFADGSGKAVYLTGSHTWSNLQDTGVSDPPMPFAFAAYLDFLQRHHHSFIRLWRWEMPKSRYSSRKWPMQTCEPHPWLRTGPGSAQDGKPRFDLTKFNPAYFDRLRERVVSAGKGGIYVSIMLFEGHCAQFAEEGWGFHPFHSDNNVNGVEGGRLDYYALKNPKVLALQEAYVREVVGTVNDLDNVLYEICNEAGTYSTEWQYHLIRFIKQDEATKPKQHPVGMTFQYRGGKNADLFASPADWVSPNPDGGYRDDPPVADGKKVVINDTDHLWGEGGNPHWVWKSFLRGHQPIFMDRLIALTGIPLTAASEDIPGADQVRKAMGHTRAMADRMNLADMIPRNDLASTAYCLANPGKEYLVYSPDRQEVTVDLSAATGAMEVEWLHPVEGTTMPGGTVPGGAKRVFAAPFSGDAVLYLRAK